MEGAARFISNKVDVPVINAGDGAGQHPTQTLLDLYTMRRTLDNINNIKIAIVGDLKYGRTVHSLVYALAMFNAEIVFISPNELQMPPEILKDLEKINCKFSIKSSLADNISDVDVVYMTRIQKERFPDPQEYLKVKGQYALKGKDLENSDVIVMHPLPRVDEISFDVDKLDKNIAIPVFENVNDGTNEGLQYVGKNIFTVQFHPEACPGPLDSGYLFDRFINMMGGNK